MTAPHEPTNTSQCTRVSDGFGERPRTENSARCKILLILKLPPVDARETRRKQPFLSSAESS